jgi:hypothetical protein
MFELKYVRPSEKEYGHTHIIKNGEEIGYFMPIRNQASGITEHWHLQYFDEYGNFQSKQFRTRREMIDYMEANI